MSYKKKKKPTNVSHSWFSLYRQGISKTNENCWRIESNRKTITACTSFLIDVIFYHFFSLLRLSSSVELKCINSSDIPSFACFSTVMSDSYIILYRIICYRRLLFNLFNFITTFCYSCLWQTCSMYRHSIWLKWCRLYLCVYYPERGNFKNLLYNAIK